MDYCQKYSLQDCDRIEFLFQIMGQWFNVAVEFCLPVDMNIENIIW